MNRPTNYWSDVIVYMLVNNMDKDTRLDWEKNLGRTSVVPSLDRVFISDLKLQTGFL